MFDLPRASPRVTEQGHLRSQNLSEKDNVEGDFLYPGLDSSKQKDN